MLLSLILEGIIMLLNTKGGSKVGLAESDLCDLQDAKSRLKVAGLIILSPAEYNK